MTSDDIKYPAPQSTLPSTCFNCIPYPLMSKYGPNEDSHSFLLEKTFVSSNFLAAIGYGALIVLYCICASHLFKRRKSRGSIVFFRLAYITVLILLESLVTIIPIWQTEEMYIINRNYPGGPIAFMAVAEKLPGNILFYVSLFLQFFLSDLLVFWRCWVIWNSKGRLVACVMVACPAIILVASCALWIAWLVQTNLPGFSIYSRLSIALGIAYFLTSVGVNIIVTALIILCLFLHRRAVSDLLPSDFARHYFSVATIVVESALLYSTFGIAFIVSYAMNHPLNQIFASLAITCQQIAGYLIILRVAQGRAWTSNTITKMGTISEHLTELRFHQSTAHDEIQLGLVPGFGSQTSDRARLFEAGSKTFFVAPIDDASHSIPKPAANSTPDQFPW